MRQLMEVLAYRHDAKLNMINVHCAVMNTHKMYTQFPIRIHFQLQMILMAQEKIPENVNGIATNFAV